MNTETEKLHQALRDGAARKIIASPGEFKICDQCQSVAFKRAPVCPICHAYRWREEESEVTRIAAITTQNPFPTTAGTVPRL